MSTNVHIFILHTCCCCGVTREANLFKEAGGTLEVKTLRWWFYLPKKSSLNILEAQSRELFRRWMSFPVHYVKRAHWQFSFENCYLYNLLLRGLLVWEMSDLFVCSTCSNQCWTCITSFIDPTQIYTMRILQSLTSIIVMECPLYNFINGRCPSLF